MIRCILPFLFTAAAIAAEPNRAANTVVLDENAVKNLKLQTVEAEQTDFEDTVFALGRIQVAPGHRAYVSSRVPGRAIQVSTHIDTQIEKGAEAVVIESRQPGEPPPSVKLHAPISGYVSEVKVAPGQPVSPDDSLIEILDLSAVHAVAAVPEHLAGRVQIGQEARIRAAGYPDKEFLAKVVHLGTSADAEAGTIEAAFHLDNPDGILRPGMRTEFSIILSKREEVMSIPREAIQGDVAQRFVYVRDYELKTAFVKTPVELGAQNDRSVEVVKGLLPGDEVVTRGAYALAFAGKGSVSLREALDAAHGHPHNEDGSEMTKEQAAAAHGASEAHSHESAHRWNTLTVFFAATTGLLLVLLVVAMAGRRQPQGAQ
jgi:cobalt-zinc-cadmium efflux system membrane fusion protein